MIFSALPPLIQIAVLALVGAVAGAVVNWAIYRLAYFRLHTVSPWQNQNPESSNRKWLDRIPIFGWFHLRRDRELHGAGFWIRPLLIELTWAIGLPLFYLWQQNGGLLGGFGVSAIQAETWFFAHAVLIGLMFVATFIDFDEKMIPDGVTVTGTLFALVFATLLPSMRLSEIAGPTVEPIHFNSPLDLPVWHHTASGLAAALAIYTFWIFALLPKTFWWRQGITGMIRFLVASVIRPRRKTKCRIRVRRRQAESLTRILAIIWLAGMVLIPIAWFNLALMTGWSSLFGSLVGLLVGGVLVWAIRIVGSWAMGQEAMGFGDVTLMFMIGAFLGWQAAILTFVFSPFAALAITLFHFLVTRKNVLAFGPYLCLSGLLVILFWSSIWPVAQSNFFSIGLGWFSLVLAAALILMPMLLFLLLWVKGEPDDDEE